MLCDDDDPLDRVEARGAGAGAARVAGAGADLRTPPSPEARAGAGAEALGAGALGAGVALGAGAALRTRPSPEARAGACVGAVLGAGVAGVDRRMLPIAAPDERVVDRFDEGAGAGTRVGGLAVDGLLPRSCDGVVVVVGTGRVRVGADPSVAVPDRSTRPPMAGSVRRPDALTDGLAPEAPADGVAPRRVVPPIVVVVDVRVPCRPRPPAAARVLVAAPRVVEIFGWLSTVAVRADRTALLRPSIVSVRGRSPRRGRGRQTFE